MRAFALAILAATSYAVLLRQPNEDKKKPEKDGEGEGDCPFGGDGEGDCPFEGDCPLDGDKIHPGFLHAAGQMIAEVDGNEDGVVDGDEAEAVMLALEEEEDIELTEEDWEMAEAIFHEVAGEDEKISKEELGGALEFGLGAIDWVNTEVYGEDPEESGSAWVDFVIASELLAYGDKDGSLSVSPREFADKVEEDIRQGTKDWAEATGEEVDEDEVDAVVEQVRGDIEAGGEELLEEADLDMDGELSYAEAYVAVVEAHTEHWDMEDLEWDDCEDCGADW